ncbi:MAG: hypothetical protein MUF60_09505 [Vicinamibacterales bacterium]|jgi:hypothetical protein|nr:hypothetical protein [Vicinamibacterales bacterium]
MSTDFWSDPEMFQSGDYVKFDAIGDTVTGTITAVRNKAPIATRHGVGSETAAGAA